ncbi:phosphoserine aminotransferase [Nesidiocoris tenuis]|uniref:Phosphoserine aminotransferase n=1 Tax=Nesidiocoris tenuis TaxID=355587 RepID=A0ABN7AUR7_9HEMI|nr:phosphoserine aminotransferase [Nesidiocoris tenuis]
MKDFIPLEHVWHRLLAVRSNSRLPTAKIYQTVPWNESGIILTSTSDEPGDRLSKNRRLTVRNPPVTGKMPTINFGAGPAKMPEDVMRQAQREFVFYGNTGLSVIEMSHRSSHYENINQSSQDTLRRILKVPDNYKILFLQGGGTGMFAAVAMNLMGRTGTADYLVTGSWSAKAAKEAAKYGKVNLVVPKANKYTEIPPPETWNLDSNASYLYYCANETVHGVEFQYVPESNGVPLVADMSSNFLSRPFDVSKFGVIFAGAQKNVGPSGVTLVIVREDLLGNALPICPLVFDFTVMAQDNSLHNTPPTFGVYFTGLVFKWIEEKGGVEKMAEWAKAKSSLVYDTIDQSNGFYSCPVNPECRSRMNIPFRIKTEELEQLFLKEAQSKGMIQLKGHRIVGGIRASLYNAVTLDETNTLVQFMKEFMKSHQ